MSPLVIKALVFSVATIVTIWITRRSILDRESHGFYRLLAFESIFLLILVNIDYWFKDVLAARQMTSWLLLILSVVPGVWGIALLVKLGRPDPGRNDPSLVGIERTTKLVTSGIYKYIRHPLYSSLLLFTWGAFLKQVSHASSCLCLAASIFLFMTAIKEEKGNIGYFGKEYHDYMSRTKRFIPFIV